MKATINNLEIEGKPEEIAKLIVQIEKIKKQPPTTTFPSYPMFEYQPPAYVVHLPPTIPANPIIYPQVWCGVFTGRGSTTCKQGSNVQMYN